MPKNPPEHRLTWTRKPPGYDRSHLQHRARRRRESGPGHAKITEPKPRPWTAPLGPTAWLLRSGETAAGLSATWSQNPPEASGLGKTSSRACSWPLRFRAR
jgi:hypothetical protein